MLKHLLSIARIWVCRDCGYFWKGDKVRCMMCGSANVG